MAPLKFRYLSVWNILLLLVAALYLLTPLWGTAEFSLETGTGKYGFDAYRTILHSPEFKNSLLLSLKLALATVTISSVLMVPTVFWINLRFPEFRPVIDFISVLPLVVPPIILTVGILRLFHSVVWLLSGPQILAAAYVVLALPFTYRSLDAGMRAIDFRTLTEAAQSVGASWPLIVLRVVMPNLRFAILSATLLTITLVIGEFTMASLMLFNTFPVYMEFIGETQASPSAALAMISFGLTWLTMLGVLLVGRDAARAQVQIGGIR